ncbi:hypothetical protein ACF0H5_013959 [Mactra antiquata]
MCQNHCLHCLCTNGKTLKLKFRIKSIDKETNNIPFMNHNLYPIFELLALKYMLKQKHALSSTQPKETTSYIQVMAILVQRRLSISLKTLITSAVQESMVI